MKILKNYKFWMVISIVLLLILVYSKIWSYLNYETIIEVLESNKKWLSKEYNCLEAKYLDLSTKYLNSSAKYLYLYTEYLNEKENRQLLENKVKNLNHEYKESIDKYFEENRKLEMECEELISAANIPRPH